MMENNLSKQFEQEAMDALSILLGSEFSIQEKYHDAKPKSVVVVPSYYSEVNQRDTDGVSLITRVKLYFFDLCNDDKKKLLSNPDFLYLSISPDFEKNSKALGAEFQPYTCIDINLIYNIYTSCLTC